MKCPLVALLLLLINSHSFAQRTLSIWPDKAPGSEDWTWAEQVDSVTPGDPLVYNVVRPELIFFPSAGSHTAVIICPGGSFCYLHIKTEGTDVAHWLNARGVSAFVLKYRVVHSLTIHPMQEKTERAKDTASVRRLMTQIVPMAIEDGKQALAYVRHHAAALGISPNQIGMMGFSAGGALASTSAQDYTADNRPDFAAPIYAFVPPYLTSSVPKDAPPLFIAAASDDEYHMVPMSVGLYDKWLASGHSAELHIYSKGGHGFGMNKQDQPSDGWIERFGDWLKLQGFLKDEQISGK